MTEEINWGQLHKDATTVLTGDFSVVIVKAEAAKSQNDKPMIKCQLKITAGPYVGRVILHNFTVSAENPTAMQMFFRHMAVLGLDTNFFSTASGMDSIAAALLGKQAVVTLENKPWQGVDREQVKAWKKASDVPVTFAGSATMLEAQSLSVGVLGGAAKVTSELPKDPF